MCSDAYGGIQRNHQGQQHVPISTTHLLGKPTSWSYCITSLDSTITDFSTPIDSLTSPQANQLPEELLQRLPLFFLGVGSGGVRNKLGQSEHSLDPLLMYFYYLSLSADYIISIFQMEFFF